MIRILFVCHGNICRSVMAEYMLDHLIRENGWESFLSCDSAATSLEEIGNPIHYGARRCLLRHGIPIGDHRARRITKDDYGRYDWIIGMDEENMYDLAWFYRPDPKKKIASLLSFAGKKKEIADPWYTGQFEDTYRDLEEGLGGLIDHLKKQGTLP